MNIYFTSHIDSGNRGCEAITKGTLECCQLEKSRTIIFSKNIDIDKKFGFHNLVHILGIKKNLIVVRAFAKVFNRIRRTDYYWLIPYFKYFCKIKKDDLAISSGGDLFCYDGREVSAINNYLTKRKIRTVLWGCSIGKENLTEQKIETLKKYSLITVRERITEKTLNDIGLKNVFFYPDSAFILKPIECILPNSFLDNRMIGLNISNFVNEGFESNSIFYNNIIAFIHYIIDNTNLSILLVPHVFWKGQDDRILSQVIFQKMETTNRVFLLNSSDLSYCEIRYVISKCRFFIGARTHSMISAYAMQIPSIALGYSVKSKGIAEDIGMGSFVLDCKNLRNNYVLKEAFRSLFEKEEAVRKHLQITMPEYIDKVYSAKDSLDQLLSRNM